MFSVWETNQRFDKNVSINMRLHRVLGKTKGKDETSFSSALCVLNVKKTGATVLALICGSDKKYSNLFRPACLI